MNSFRGSEEDVFGVAFTPDGSTLVSSGRMTPFVWDVATARTLLRFTDGENPSLRNWTDGAAVAPAGDKLAFGSGDPFTNSGGLDVFQLDADRGVRTFRGLSGAVEKVWLSPDGKLVAALSHTWQLGVWERVSGRVKFVWDVPAGWTANNSAAAFDGDSVLFASGTHCTRWSLTTGERAEAWALPLGVDDHLVVRPTRPPLLVRRDTPVRDGERAPVRGRELLPDGKSNEVYRLPEEFTGLLVRSMSADGRYLVANRDRGGHPHLFDGRTGERATLDPTRLPPQVHDMWVSASGGVLTATEAVNDGFRSHLYRLPDLTRLGVHSGPDLRADDAGKLAAALADGVSLTRVGETRPLVTLDPGRPPVSGSIVLGADGKFVAWGRRDGTVCVADVNKCLEQLAPFGKR